MVNAPHSSLRESTERNYCCTLCGPFLYPNKISQKCFFFLSFPNAALWKAADGRNAARCPDLCQLSEFDNLNWQGKLEETTFLSINDVALTRSSVTQFNMDVIKPTMSRCTVLPVLSPVLCDTITTASLPRKSAAFAKCLAQMLHPNSFITFKTTEDI